MPARNFRELHDQIVADPERAKRLEEAERRVEAELAAYEQSLAELRRARAYTQAQLAKALHVSQAQVSRIEHQTDLYLSTLQSYLEAMGGRLELIGVFGGTRVVLSLADLADTREEPRAELAATPS